MKFSHIPNIPCVSGIGDITAASISRWMAAPSNVDLMRRLRAAGLACMQPATTGDRDVKAVRRGAGSGAAAANPSASDEPSKTAARKRPGTAAAVGVDDEPSPSLSSSSRAAALDDKGGSLLLRGLEGKTIVVTGKLVQRGDLTREHFAELVAASGGEVADGWRSSVSLVVQVGGRRLVAVAPLTHLPYLVQGYKPGKAKLEKARSSGVEVLLEEEFWDRHGG